MLRTKAVQQKALFITALLLFIMGYAANTLSAQAASRNSLALAQVSPASNEIDEAVSSADTSAPVYYNSRRIAALFGIVFVGGAAFIYIKRASSHKL